MNRTCSLRFSPIVTIFIDPTGRKSRKATMKHIITTPTTVTLLFSIIVASVLTTINAQNTTPILIYKPPASSSSSDGGRVEMWLQVLTVCVTNAVMLPAIVMSYRKCLYPECVSIGMLFITSMFYHVGETLKVDILGMTHGQWHRLDNIFIICCLQSLFLFLCFSTRVTHMRGYSAWHNQLQQQQQLEQPPQNFTEQLSRLPQASNVNTLTTTTPITSSPVRSPHHHHHHQQPQQQLQPSQPRRSITPLRVATTNTTNTTTFIAKSSTTPTTTAATTTTTRHLVKDELYIERQNSRIELVRWLGNAFVIFCQEKAPWQVLYTVLPILLMATYSFVQLWRTPARYRPRFNRKKLLGGLLFVLLGLIFFVRGLDDDNDYLKMNHGLWHSLAGIGCLCLLSGKQDSVHLTKFLNERRTRIETMDNEEVDSNSDNSNTDIAVNNSSQLEVEHSIDVVHRSNSNSNSSSSRSSSSSSGMTSIRVVSPDSSLSSPLSTTTVMTPVSTTSVHSRWRETSNANVNSSSNRNNSSSTATITSTTDFEEV